MSERVLFIKPRGDYMLTRFGAEHADSREMDANEILFEQICPRRRGDVRNADGTYANSDRSGQAVTTAGRYYVCSAGRSSSSAGRPENESGVRTGPHELLPGPERRRGQEVLAVPPRGAVAFMRSIL
jgi:hypothetical protein